MIAWFNFAVLLFATILLLYFYVLSARPAAQGKIVGPAAYQRCFYYRLIATGAEFVITATTLMLVGVRDAGEEAIRPKKDHTMYGGIYVKIRHPQAVGEVFLFAVIGLLLHSPFLTIFSLVYFPILAMMCYTEEADLSLRYGDAYAEYYRNPGAFWPKRRA